MDISRRLRLCLPSLLAVAAGLAVPAVHAAPVPGQGTWQTTLQARDLDGNGQTDAFYDTVLNITWLRAGTTTGTNWATANAWATGLTLGGYSDWRLPTSMDTGEPGVTYIFDADPGVYAGGTDSGYNVLTSSGGTVYSEMASLFYDTLGNLAYCPPHNLTCSAEQPGWGLSNTGEFINLVAGTYWSGLLESATSAGTFQTSIGFQSGDSTSAGQHLALAVRPGDSPSVVVNPGNSVPEPGSLALTAFALVLLGGRKMRRQAAV